MSETPPPPVPSQPPQERWVTVSLPVRRPWVTYTLIALGALLFLAQWLSEYLLHFDLPAALGMKVNELILQGQWWRLITPAFLHGSLMHLAFNLYALYSLGPALESHYGHGRLALLYFLGALGGNVFSFLFTRNPSLGSSTAIFGLLGAFGVFLYQNRRLFGAGARQALGNVLLIALANLIIGLSPRIDNWGHLGGLLAGGAFAWFAGPLYHLVLEEGQPPRLANARSPLQVWLAALLVGGLALSLAWLKVSGIF